jgi:spore coat polysaccharide biosynthesis predicted glycosyltransferase SpsG
VSAVVGFVADAQPGTGLGHISRCSAIALALTCKGIGVDCYALGSDDALERDGIPWRPLGSIRDAPLAEAAAIVVDSYVVPAEDELTLAAGRPLLLMPERRDIEHATLAVETAFAPDADPRHLFGPRFACLRAPFWGLKPRPFSETVQGVLITMGAYDSAGLSVSVAQRTRSALPDAAVRVVRGPKASFEAPDGVEVVEAPPNMLDPLLDSDLVICAGGQTSLEAATTGTPSITFTLIDNQVGNATLLEELGVSISVSPDDPEALTSALKSLAGDPARRRKMGEDARTAIDGFGAHRVAFALGRLIA